MEFDLSTIKEDFSIVTGSNCGKCKTLINYLKTTSLTFHIISEELNKEEFEYVAKKFDICMIPVIIKKDLTKVVDLSNCISYCRTLNS